VTNSDSTSNRSKSCADTWHELLAWLDHWFQPEKIDAHDFGAPERELFGSLAASWAQAEMGAGKIAALESAANAFGRERVLALLEKVCADETRSHWARVVRDEDARSLDDLVRLLWKPLPALGFVIESERFANGIQLRCTRCPHYDLARRLGGGAADWLYHLVCALPTPTSERRSTRLSASGARRR
jgi:hypothetical protein